MLVATINDIKNEVPVYYLIYDLGVHDCIVTLIKTGEEIYRSHYECQHPPIAGLDVYDHSRLMELGVSAVENYEARINPTTSTKL